MQAVITTINKPTQSVKEITKRSNTIVVADYKTPNDWNHNGVNYIPFDTDFTGFESCKFIPINHYARKNLGYLIAIQNWATCIYDTDDDNTPNNNWKRRSVEVEASESVGQGWYNVYDLLTDKYIWPRGFSLRHVQNKPSCGITKTFTSSIQQGLADGEADIDAIHRLLYGKPTYFEHNKSIYLKPGAWCPFNSQSTWWFPKAYPLMYLPVTASFRMTDIWRSLVAQRCLWELGEGVTFHSPSEVFQDRNEHDLLKDFKDEIPGYLNNELIVQILTDLKLNGDIFDNMMACYRALVDEGIMVMHELRSLRCWINDVKQIWKP